MALRTHCVLVMGLLSVAAGFANVPPLGTGAHARSPPKATSTNFLRQGPAARGPDGWSATASAGLANSAFALLTGALGGLLLATSSARATLDDVATNLPYDLAQRIERLEKWRDLAKRVEELEALQLKALGEPVPSTSLAPPAPPAPPRPAPQPAPAPTQAPAPAPAAQKPTPKPVAPKISKPAIPVDLEDYEDDDVDLSSIIPQTKIWTYRESNAWKSAGYPVCAEGKEQSPIDLDEDRAIDVKASGSLASRLNYKPMSGLKIFNNENRNVQVNGDFGTMTLPDGVYDAFQFHFHFPAEHEIGGKRAAGELHIVHQKRGAKGTDGLAVVGILLEETKDPETAGRPETQLMEKLYFRNQLPKKGEKKQVDGDVDLRAFVSEFKGGYYHYLGSLTTPPCSEKVHWYVLEEPAYVTKDMIRSYKKLFPSNNRPVQPLNKRELAVSDVALPNEFSR